ncbi:hypothetical protein BU23DRAFT_552339 [Bimuria novae-zelandiae CBS 107.79]|uniref:Peptidase S33 tripeptidyl aminopeptidase-like C-terminal domain-containing protein n=1 Tax=Bimuria novae-zelandiae CBS 107.79 TaxID=1447943 RepID=A0A6A5VFD9_9PLEO|nr:hypothetical protein BU23DRAFT_552339 [Bimuria novae-zelandiae CBS 107.79]
MTILQHCSRLRGLNGVSKPQWESFNWDAINATEQFEFHPCFGDFQCAKLKVPLDYFNGTHPNSSASIAIAKLPAQVPIDDPRYAGPMLINPGGPGGSGISLALMQAHNLRTVVGPSHSETGDKSEGKHYDILGFDPRGIGFTEPKAYCMPDNPSSWSWRLRETTEGILGSSDAALGRLWSMSHAYGQSCKQHSGADGSPDIKQYMSTASVARDMLEVAEKHAEWVADKSKQLAQQGLAFSRIAGSEPFAETQTIYKRGEVKLIYAGFSYGTYLGSTFAAMFPDRVGRLYLDGVVNAHDYNNGLAQGSLIDTEKDMKSFYTFCALAGAEVCPLATPTASIEDIEQRTQRIIKSLYHNPITLNTEDGPEIFTYSDLKSIIFSSLYIPAEVFPGLAQILLAVETRSGPVLDAIAKALRISHVYTCPVLGSPAMQPIYFDVSLDAILCGDGPPINDLDVKSMEEYWQLLEGISPSAAGIWSMLRMKCAAWQIRPLMSFGRDELLHGNTSHPILFVSSTADPVTPLRSARIMSSKYPGSRVLVQDSAGHCALSTPTACTINAIKNYFQTGELPELDTVCIPPTSPWSLNSTDPKSPFYDPSLGQAVFLAEDSMEEEMEAARGLQSWAASHLGFGRSHLGPRVADMMGALRAYSSGEKTLKDEL